MPSHPTLSVRNLAIEYQTRRGWVKAAQAVNFDLLPGEALALIGESGSGKTTVGTSLIRLLPGNATISAGEIVYRRPVADGSVTEIDVRALDAEGLRRFRWKEAAMVFQGSMNAFNPVLRISDQFNDTSRAHGGPRGRELVDLGASAQAPGARCRPFASRAGAHAGVVARPRGRRLGRERARRCGRQDDAQRRRGVTRTKQRRRT